MQIMRNLSISGAIDWMLPLDSISCALKNGMNFGQIYAFLNELWSNLNRLRFQVATWNLGWLQRTIIHSIFIISLNIVPILRTSKIPDIWIVSETIIHIWYSCKNVLWRNGVYISWVLWFWGYIVTFTPSDIHVILYTETYTIIYHHICIKGARK